MSVNFQLILGGPNPLAKKLQFRVIQGDTYPRGTNRFYHTLRPEFLNGHRHDLPRISMDNLTYFLWFWTAFFWKLGRGIKWRRCLYVLFSELHACFEQNNQCPKLKIATLLPHDPVMFPFIHLGMAILVQFNASLPGVHQAWRLSKRVPGIWLGHVRIGFNYYSIFAKRTYHFSSTGAAFFGWFDRARLWESLRMFENEL